MTKKVSDGSYILFNDNTVFPAIEASKDVSYLLRYGSMEGIEKRRLYIASIVSAYVSLIGMAQDRRNKVCKVLKEAK